MIAFRSFVVLALSAFLAGNVEASADLGSGIAPAAGALNGLTGSHSIPVVNRRHGFQHRRAAAASKAKAKSKRQDGQRCRQRDTTPSDSTPASPAVENVVAQSSSTSSSATPEATTANLSQANAVAGLINVQSTCGDIGATSSITALSGPNGKLDWLNCGIDQGGWNPPHVEVSDLVAADLAEAVKSGNSPFTACSAFIDTFYKYGQQFNVPPIMLASFAMQESTCNPDAVGGNGEQGLMQITQDKCGGAPGGNCRDPDFNIYTGVKYFSDSLASNNGNVLLTIGMYNGWHQGMTVGDATAAALTGACFAQNNLDYLMQFCNGWMQNVDARTANPPLGRYFNLLQCS